MILKMLRSHKFAHKGEYYLLLVGHTYDVPDEMRCPRLDAKVVCVSARALREDGIEVEQVLPGKRAQPLSVLEIEEKPFRRRKNKDEQPIDAEPADKPAADKEE